MIIATPNGKYYSEYWSSENGFRHTLEEIDEGRVKHLCQNSDDYIVHRRLTLRELIRVYTKR